MGPIILNFAATVFVPSWINLKKSNVSVHTTVWSTIMITTLIYLALGIIPSLAFDLSSNTDESVLPSLIKSGPVSRICCYVFTFVMLLPAIPVSVIITHFNVKEIGVHESLSAFLSFILPWLISIPFLNGLWFDHFINWTGIIFVCTANFVFPFVIYFKSLSFRDSFHSTRGIFIIRNCYKYI